MINIGGGHASNNYSEVTFNFPTFLTESVIQSYEKEVTQLHSVYTLILIISQWSRVPDGLPVLCKCWHPAHTT